MLLSIFVYCIDPIIVCLYMCSFRFETSAPDSRGWKCLSSQDCLFVFVYLSLFFLFALLFICICLLILFVRVFVFVYLIVMFYCFVSIWLFVCFRTLHLPPGAGYTLPLNITGLSKRSGGLTPLPASRIWVDK